MEVKRRIDLRAAAGLFFAAAIGGGPAAAGVALSDASSATYGKSECSGASVAEALETVARSTQLSVELLAAISGEGRRNALISPLGVDAVLSMAAEGATAPVREEIRELLGEGLDCRLEAMRSTAQQDPGAELNIANGVFADRHLDLFPAFSTALRARFGARVDRLNFADEGAVERINAWVAEETRAAIPRLLSQLDPGAALVLANAVHFQGEWSQRFDSARTEPRPFHPSPGESIEVATMRADDLPARYREDAGFQAVVIPYGNGGFAAVVVLPRPGLDVTDALRRLASDSSWLNGRGFDRARGSLVLPRMVLRGDVSLLPILHDVGLEAALNVPGGFAGIAAPPPRLNEVVHRTLLEVDEKGTEAAAATAAISTRAALPEEETAFEMRVDRPFAFAIRHVPSGGLLFAAWVAMPTERG